MLVQKSAINKPTIESMCDDIVTSYHTPIMVACKAVSIFLQSNNIIKDFAPKNTELLQLLHQKLEDELSHLFLKESGIIFPSVKIKAAQHAATLLASSVLDLVVQSHARILQLLQKERQILNNYVTSNKWDASWINIVNELFNLESLVQRYIHLEQSKIYPLLINPELH
jgi:iron-sulfur cluster repair protein YtfE (RIC family)